MLRAKIEFTQGGIYYIHMNRGMNEQFLGGCTDGLKILITI